MYNNHNIRTNLKESINRLYRAPHSQFGNQLTYLINSFEKEKIISYIINDICLLFTFDENTIIEMENNIAYGTVYGFESEAEQAAFSYQFIKYLIKKFGAQSILNLTIMQKESYEQNRDFFIEVYLSPLLNYFHDQLDKSSSTIYLLEKYKKRTEWFNKEKLYMLYKDAEKNYEKIFEDDLRLFLFDQGIDYPFSTPQSTSGRADIIGSIDTSDPLIVEIKIYDNEKGYKKNRIVEGLTQIIKYTNDFHKDFGYLVIFNIDPIEIDFQFHNKDKIFPPSLSYNNKTYYFIVINILPQESASKIGTTKIVTITEEELIQSLND